MLVALEDLRTLFAFQSDGRDLCLEFSSGDGGLGALLAAYRACLRNGNAFKIVRASKRTRELLVVTRLSAILKAFNSIEDALQDQAFAQRSWSSAPNRAYYTVATER